MTGRAISMEIRKLMDFRNLPIFWKISSLPIMAMGITILGMLLFLLPKVDKMMLAEEKQVPKQVKEGNHFEKVTHLILNLTPKTWW